MDDPVQRIPVGDVTGTYRRKGSGPPLLYLHGMGLTGRWLELYELLSERFDVIVPEHPGFGATARPRWYRSLDDVALYHADLLTALGIGSAHVIGHSLGGRVAGSFGALFPERLRSLTLIAPAPLAVVRPEGPPPGDLPADFEFDSLLFNGRQADYPDFRDGDDEGRLLAEPDGDPHADPEAWSLDTAPSLYRRLARITCPVQVLEPDEDQLLPPATFEDWSRWLGDAPLVKIPGAVNPTGHLLIVQEPQAIADAVGAFALDGAGAGAAGS